MAGGNHHGRYHTSAADAADLVDQADSFIAARAPFRIEAGPFYPHKKALVTMLRSWAGEPVRRGFWRSIVDAWFMGNILTVWVNATQGARYNWRFEIADERLSIIFDPTGHQRGVPSVEPRAGAFSSGREHKIIMAGEPEVYRTAKRTCEEGRPFIIRADKSFRHTKRLMRTLRFMYEGMKDDRWMWTALLDVYCLGKILSSSALTDEYNYRWRYEYTEDGVDLIFDPPASCRGPGA
jgi:hypothetical protein